MENCIALKKVSRRVFTQPLPKGDVSDSVSSAQNGIETRNVNLKLTILQRREKPLAVHPLSGAQYLCSYIVHQ